MRYGVKEIYINSLIIYNRLLYETLTDESDEKAQEMRKINDYFLGLSKPGIFHPSDKNNLIKAAEDSFESICTLMEEKYNVHEPSKLTLFRFISRIEYIEEQIDRHKIKA